MFKSFLLIECSNLFAKGIFYNVDKKTSKTGFHFFEEQQLTYISTYIMKANSSLIGQQFKPTGHDIFLSCMIFLLEQQISFLMSPLGCNKKLF